MDKGENYEVKDISLAEQGRKNIEWAEQHMKIMGTLKERFAKGKTFEGVRIGFALHVTKETAVLIRALRAGGAEVAIAGCNPLSTQDDVAAALAEEGVAVFAYKGETKVLTKKPELLPEIIGGCEETTTGIIRLRAMEKDGVLKYPMIAVNDNKTKHLLDNYYGTGQSTIDGILRASNVLFAGKTVVVAGYGDCGKGVALRAKGFGSDVVVTEVDAFRGMRARLDGYRVMPMAEAAKIGDIFITVTGDKNVVTVELMKTMKDGVMLANSGHFNNEVDVDGLNKAAESKEQLRPFLEKFILGGKKLYLCAEGRLVNLSAAEGHPSEVMATSFAGQALACKYLLDNKGKLENKVITLPEEIDGEIAKLQLDAMGVKIDSLTAEQEKYLGSWEEGT